METDETYFSDRFWKYGDMIFVNQGIRDRMEDEKSVSTIRTFTYLLFFSRILAH